MRQPIDRDDKRKLNALLIFFAAGWGLLEAALPLGLKAHCPVPLLGAVLSGTAFFFLGACGLAGGSFSAPLKALLFVLLMKVSGIWLAGAGNPLQTASGPLTAYILQAGVFALILALAGKRLFATRRSALGFGALAGFAAAMLYAPALFLLGQRVCIAPGTSLPASITYAPLTTLLAAVSTLLGMEAVKRVRFFIVTKSARLESLLYLASLAAFFLSLTLYNLKAL